MKFKDWKKSAQGSGSWPRVPLLNAPGDSDTPLPALPLPGLGNPTGLRFPRHQLWRPHCSSHEAKQGAEPRFSTLTVKGTDQQDCDGSWHRTRSLGFYADSALGAFC